MKKASKLKSWERLEISILLRKGYLGREIARVLSRSPNTVSEEIKRNKVLNTYDPRKAQHKAYVRRKYAKYQGMKIREHKGLEAFVREKIIQGWSPEYISGRLKEIETGLPYVSERCIYKYVRSIYGRDIEQFLPRYRRSKRKHPSTKGVASIPNRVFIENRPLLEGAGHWEGDFIVSGKGGSVSLLVLMEKTTNHTLVYKLKHRRIPAVHRVLAGWARKFRVQTLTLDNDPVFRRHTRIARLIGAPVYFCRPYHAWEKGSVEKTNALIRRYVKKGSDIGTYPGKFIQTVQIRLNTMPRRRLAYKTPLEAAQECGLML